MTQMNGKELTQFYHLIIASLEGTISGQDYQLLIRTIKNDKEAAVSYVEFLAIYTNLTYSSAMEVNLDLAEDYFETEGEVQNFDSAVWKELLETERTAPSVVVEKPVEKPVALPVLQPVECQLRTRKINKLSLYMAILASAALLAMVVFLRFAPVPVSEEVATVTGLANVEWGSTPHSIAKGSRLKTNTGPIYLNKGAVGLSYDSGVEVTIEGPAVFQVVTPSEIQLDYGRLYSEVSSYGLGFTVQTFNTRIIDLGTKFGVQVFPDGATELHVFKGKTALVAGVAALTKQAIDVNAGQARSICSDGSQVNAIVLKQGYFAEKILVAGNGVWRGQNLSLANLVAGGDGFTGGNIKTAIDPATGRIGANGVQAENRFGGHDYHPVDASRCIDGVFIPNGKTGAGQVSSRGHMFQFPATDGYYWSDITAYPYVMDLLTRDAAFLDVDGSGGEAASSNLIFIHSNAGITFDLQAIRKQMPGVRITGLKSRCGIGERRQGLQAAEFWVLLDGECVYHAENNADSKDDREINIDIPPDRQFLTLAVTDGGDQNSYDWCAFVNPELTFQKQ